MSNPTSHLDRQPVVTITRHRRYAKLRFDPFRFVFYFPESLWDDILKEVNAAGCRHLLGITTIFVLNVPLADASELAGRIAQIAAPYLSQSSLWLSDGGEPPPLVGLADNRPRFLLDNKFDFSTGLSTTWIVRGR